MAEARKFDFGNSFDAPEGRMVAAKDFTLADIERARAEGFAEGKEAGLAKAKASQSQMEAEALANATAALPAIAESLGMMRTGLENDAIALVKRVLDKVVPFYAKTQGLAEIEALVRECLTHVYDEPRIVVRAHESVIEPLTQKVDGMVASAGFTGKLVLFGDETLAPSDCRVEWADGGAERDIEHVWQNVEEALDRFAGAPLNPVEG